MFFRQRNRTKQANQMRPIFNNVTIRQVHWPIHLSKLFVFEAAADHSHHSRTQGGLKKTKIKLLTAKGFVGCVGTVLISVADLGLIEANPTSPYVRALQGRFSGTWTVRFVFAIWTVGLAIAPSFLINTTLKEKKVLLLHLQLYICERFFLFLDCLLPTQTHFLVQLKHIYLGKILS